MTAIETLEGLTNEQLMGILASMRPVERFSIINGHEGSELSPRRQGGELYFLQIYNPLDKDFFRKLRTKEPAPHLEQYESLLREFPCSPPAYELEASLADVVSAIPAEDRKFAAGFRLVRAGVNPVSRTYAAEIRLYRYS